MLRKHAITYALLAAPLLALPWLTGCGGDSSAAAPQQPQQYQPRVQQVEVSAVPVQRQTLTTEQEFTGNLLPRRYSRIMAEVEGVVESIPQVGERFDVEANGRRYTEQLAITYGQLVRGGDVLVQVDTKDTQLALRMADAKLKKAQADLASLKAWRRDEEVQRLAALRDEARARFEQASSNFERTESLMQNKTLTRSDYDKAAMELNTTRASLTAAEATLRQSTTGPTPEEIAVQEALIAQAQAEVQQVQSRMEKATIRAPYDAVVTSFHVERGDWVSPASGPVVELMDLQFLIAEIAVPESYVGQLHIRDRASVEIAGSLETIPGIVVAMNDYVDPQTRTFQVRVAIDNNARRFKAGQFATVHLSTGTPDVANLTVPTRSIVYEEGQPHVFVVQGDRVSSKAVQIGAANGNSTEVLAGLQEGDLVVFEDPTLLADDMQVSVRDSERLVMNP